MAFARVNGSTVSGTSVSTVTISGYGGTVTNNLVVATIVVASNRTVNSVTDSAGNTYVISSGQISGTRKTFYAYGVQTTGGSTTFTATADAASASMKFNIDEFSGGLTTNGSVFDIAGEATGNSTSPSATVTPTQSGNLIVVSLGHNTGSYTVPSGFTIGSTQASCRMAYKLSGTTSESGTGTLSSSNTWAQATISFNPNTAPPGTIDPILLIGD